MFYAQFVLAKKGPLAKIWLAAHWEKKLTKAQICETDVPQAIEEVIRPKVKMALRTVGHLLLGIVRIYSKKTRYLLADTNEAYIKMKVSFRNGFSLETQIPFNPDIDENFELVDDFNITVPEFLDADYDQRLIMANVSRLEDITMKEDCNFDAHFRITAAGDDGFGDEDYAAVEHLYGSLEPSSVRPTPEPESVIDPVEGARDGTVASAVSHAEQSSVLFEGHGFQGHDYSDNFDPPVMKFENETNPVDVGPMDMYSSMIHPDAGGAPAPDQDEPMDVEYPVDNTVMEPEHRAPTPESFALEPLDLGNMEGNNRRKRQKKPRKLLVDAVTMISDDDFRAQQEDYEDLLLPIAVAPPTRKMYNLCVSGDLPHLMNIPGTRMFNRELLKDYKSSLAFRKHDPNFTMYELSDSSSCASTEQPSAPWEDLDLNEHIADEDLAAGPAVGDEDFFAGLNDGVDFDPAPYPEFERTQYNEEPQPVEQGELQNKENDEEDWSDPFGSSFGTQRGRLEAYGFGNSAARKNVDDEGKWSKRADHILKKVTADIDASGSAAFSTVTDSAKNRKQAAEQFYSLLTLAKSQTINVEQAEPFGEIVIRAGENFKKDPKTPKPFPETPMRTPMRPV